MMRPTSEKYNFSEASPLSGSVAILKLRERQAAKKPLDVVISDIDGTLYIRTPQGAYVGRNADTKRQVESKNLPFIVNTGRPYWNIHEDQRLAHFLLPVPDVAIAGTGTMVYWRLENGTLLADQEYGETIRNHRISYQESGVTQGARFDPRLIVTLIQEQLHPFFQNEKIADVLIDKEPLLPDGTFSVEGLRIIVENITYRELRMLIRGIRTRVSGLKIDFAEIPEVSTAEHFTGWLHIVPSIAGKERAAHYVMQRLSDCIGGSEKMNAHILGDGSNDIRMLAMGVHQEHPFGFRQYALANMTDYTRTTLTKVAQAFSVEGGSRAQANLTIMNHKGPDGVYEVINALQ